MAEKETFALPDDDPRVDVAKHVLGTRGESKTVRMWAHAEPISVRFIDVMPPVRRDADEFVLPSPALKIKCRVSSFEYTDENGVNHPISFPREEAESGRVFSMGLPTATWVHHFTPAEKVGLANLGIMEPGFKVPQIMRESPYRMPCDVTMTKIMTAEGPLLSVFVEDANHIDVSTETDGYQFLEYIPQSEAMRQPQAAQPQQQGEAQLEDASLAVELSDYDDDAISRVAGKDAAPQEAHPEPAGLSDEDVAREVFSGIDELSIPEEDKAAFKDFANGVFVKNVVNPDGLIDRIAAMARPAPAEQQPEQQPEQAPEAQEGHPAAQAPDEPQATPEAEPVADDGHGLDDWAAGLDADPDDPELSGESEEEAKARKLARNEAHVHEVEHDELLAAALADGTIDAAEAKALGE